MTDEQARQLAKAIIDNQHMPIARGVLQASREIFVSLEPLCREMNKALKEAGNATPASRT